jgi:hypothetical protein
LSATIQDCVAGNELVRLSAGWLPGGEDHGPLLRQGLSAPYADLQRNGLTINNRRPAKDLRFQRDGANIIRLSKPGDASVRKG